MLEALRMRRLRRSIRTALWLLTLLVPIGLVLFDWWVSGTAGTAVVPDDRPVSPEVAGARQYVSADGDTITSTGPRSGRVVLTFDDGPDPRWTPKVLDVLLEHDVTATFFVVGEKVVDHPSIVRRMWREGHEIANHTFTHPNMEAESPWRQRFELSLTDRVIAGVTGRRVSAFRLPYSSAASEATPAEVELLHRVGNRIAVFSDGFTRDYLASDAADIVKDLERIDLSKGLVLLLHDGGGDRSATVDALDDVITTLRARGADFVSLSESLGVDRDVINPPASWFERWSGLATVEV
ncbi:MAG TPA: polysaccharide deacetylase family protein, partial [Acidimicrobiales bacterium]